MRKSLFACIVIIGVLLTSCTEPSRCRYGIELHYTNGDKETLYYDLACGTKLVESGYQGSQYIDVQSPTKFGIDRTEIKNITRFRVLSIDSIKSDKVK